MRLDRIRRVCLVVTACCGSLLLASCPLTGLVDSCFGADTISRSAYEDLNLVEQLLYEENSCGRYQRHSSFFDVF